MQDRIVISIGLERAVHTKIKQLALNKSAEARRNVTISDVISTAIAAYYEGNGQNGKSQGNSK